MGKRWRIFPHDGDKIARLQRTAGVPPVVAQLMVCRGMEDPTVVRTFLNGKLTGLREPALLPGVPEAVERIFDAVDAGGRLVIYGDYDADGMTATAILYRCLRLLGADVGYFVPNRLEDGYGLNCKALETLARRGTSLVISVDCGIASVKQAATAQQLGLDLIITDHHLFGSQLPAAAAIVHPRLPGTAYPFGELCGAGVALKLAWALAQRASGADRVTARLRNFLLTAVGLAAVGTIADVVPLLDENRLIVRHGLLTLRDQPVPGLAELMRVTNLLDKPRLSSEDVAFTLAPRLNAAGRLGQAQLGVELLTTDDSQRGAALAEYIHELNGSRESLERRIHLAASKQAKSTFDPQHDPALVLADRDWHPGVIGIVAGRLAEKYNRPVVLVSFDAMDGQPGTGSARSACGVNLHQALASCGEHLVAHGGHAAAAGLRIEPHQLETFRAAFCDAVAQQLTEQQRIAEILIDAEAPLSQLTLRTVEQIEQLAPFGQNNPRPVLCATGVELAEPPRRMGGGERHLAVKLKQHRVTMRGVGFGCGEWAEQLEACRGSLDVAFRPVINEFRGFRRVEIHLVDWRSSQHT